MRNVLLLVLIILLFSACKKEGRPQSEIDEDTITKYIADNELDANPTGSGLYYVIEEEGTGPYPSSNSTVKVYYKGYETNGSVFDESTAAGATFSLNGVIRGWQEGIPLFREGGEGILLIPSGLAYGTSGSGSVPPNAVLIFEVRVIEVL